MAKKNKGKNLIKRIQQQRQKKKLKRGHASQKKKTSIIPGIQQLFNNTPISQVESPDDFIPISLSQAIMEYAKPFMEMSKGNDAEKVFQIVQTSWNYTIMLEGGKKSEEAKTKLENSIAKMYGMDLKNASDFLEKMVQRKKDLFPPEMQQQKPSMTMFMKKQATAPITAFNYKKLNLSGDSIPADTKDKALINAIIKMDQFIIDQVEYDDWEAHYLSLEEACSDRYKKWLNDKNMSEFCHDFPYWVEIYLNYIYRYMHNDIVLLKDVQPIYMKDFFSDYVLRKVMAEPHEYVRLIPALKAFYIFLHEKGYFESPEPMTELLDIAEPIFFKTLKKRT